VALGGVAIILGAAAALFYYEYYLIRRNRMAMTESAIVKPIVQIKDAVDELHSFEEMKAKLLARSDYQMIRDKAFIKKSGWRKLALVFNISDEIIESSKSTRNDGSFVWTFKIRAKAPNGRYTEAIASCDSKERSFTHLEHDVQATAQTRAKSRAISDLIGAGDVSAEELEYDEEEPRPLLAKLTH
jgi:hypothetical protein